MMRLGLTAAFAGIIACTPVSARVSYTNVAIEFENKLKGAQCHPSHRTFKDIPGYDQCGDPKEAGTGVWYDCSNSIDRANRAIYAWNDFVRNCREKNKERAQRNLPPGTPSRPQGGAERVANPKCAQEATAYQQICATKYLNDIEKAKACRIQTENAKDSCELSGSFDRPSMTETAAAPSPAPRASASEDPLANASCHRQQGGRVCYVYRRGSSGCNCVGEVGGINTMVCHPNHRSSHNPSTHYCVGTREVSGGR